MSMSLRHALLLSAAVLLGGCEVTTELGKPCFLVRKATEEELKAGSTRAVRLKESALTPGQDFISFGSAECEDLICVRDAAFQGSTNPDEDAQGYCSRDCVAGGSSCTVTDTEVPAELRERMTCRALLMDNEALARLKASDPATYRATFGENDSAYFCAGEPPPSSQN
jgi:hypothetical protein